MWANSLISCDWCIHVVFPVNFFSLDYEDGRLEDVDLMQRDLVEALAYLRTTTYNRFSPGKVK